MRIEICGGIASGKTTLATMCAEAGLEVGLERFQENPFFEKFYDNPDQYAFETELTYLLQHFSQVRELASLPRIAVDFSFALDLAYARVTLPTSDQRTFESLLDDVISKIALPTMIVRLECTSAEEHRRIIERQRPAEQRIERSFLDEMDLEIERALRSCWFSGVPVHRVNSEVQDFRAGGKDRERVLEQVVAAASLAA